MLLRVFRRKLLLLSSGPKHTSLLNMGKYTVGTHISLCTAVELVTTSLTAQLYSWYPTIILYIFTVGTHQSYCTAVQLVPTNHTAQLYIWYPTNHTHCCTVATLLSYITMYSLYPSITLHSSTVGTHKSHCTALQFVPTNHTAQL